MRSTMKMAFSKPVLEMRRNPIFTRSRSPGVKNRFKMAVNTTMNTTGFKPFTMVLNRTLEIFTQAKRVNAIRP